MKDFSLRLESLWEKSGLKKKDISKMLGYSDNTFGSYVSGRTEPGIEALSKLSEIFGVSVDYLVNGLEYKPNEEKVKQHEKADQVVTIFKERGLDNPFILQPQKWALLSEKDLFALSNFFEFLVKEAKERKS